MNLKSPIVLFFLVIVLFSCKKEKSFEGGNDISTCTPDYKGDCKLLSASYNTFNPNNPVITYTFNYTGNLISKINTDFGFNINIIYNGNNLISRLEYEDDASGDIFYYEELFYNSLKKPDSLRSWNLGVAGFEYNNAYHYKYNSNGLLAEKTLLYFDASAGAIVKQNVLTFKYDSGQVTLMTDTSLTNNPPFVIPYPITASSTCNPFQLIYPQIELFDYNGDDFGGGYSVLFTAQKIPSAIGTQLVEVTYNSKNAPTTITVDGDLWATYTYSCP